MNVNKKMSEKNTVVNPRVYYQRLSRQDKTQFLEYLLVHYGIKTNTIRRKLARKQFGVLSKLEEVTIMHVIQEEQWQR